MLTDELADIRIEITALRATAETALSDYDDDEQQDDQETVDGDMRTIEALVTRNRASGAQPSDEHRVHLEIDISGTREEVTIILAEIRRIQDRSNKPAA